MANGRPGDHPYTDIVTHKQSVYSQAADDLVREIDALGDERTRRELADRLIRNYNELDRPDLAALETELTALRDRLREDAARRGWERQG